MQKSSFKKKKKKKKRLTKVTFNNKFHILS